jgi:tetratricopeptide (TPR) repeat protein
MKGSIFIILFYFSAGVVNCCEFTSFNTRVDSDTSTAVAFTNKAIEFYSVKKFDSCVYYLKESLKADSNYHLAHYWLGLLEYHVRKKVVKSELHFLKATRADHPGKNVYAYLGSMCVDRNEYMKAESYYKQGMKLEPLDTFYKIALIDLYLKSDRSRKANALMNELLEANSSSIKLLMNLGSVFEKNKYYIIAERMYKKVMALDSNYTLAYFKLGGVYVIKDRHFAAAPLYERANYLDKNYLMSFYGFYLEAETLYKKAHTPDSNYAISFNKLGWLYTILDCYVEAEVAYKKAVDLDPGYVDALNNLGWLYILTRQDNEAKGLLIRAYQLDSMNVHAITLLAWIKYKSKNILDAEKEFTKAIQINPAYLPALFGMAYLQSGKGKMNEAYAYLDRAIKNKTSMRQLRTAENFPSLSGICLLHSAQGLTFEMLQHDENLVLLRNMPKWKVMMKKFFPKDNQ